MSSAANKLDYGVIQTDVVNNTEPMTEIIINRYEHGKSKPVSVSQWSSSSIRPDSGIKWIGSASGSGSGSGSKKDARCDDADEEQLLKIISELNNIKEKEQQPKECKGNEKYCKPPITSSALTSDKLSSSYRNRVKVFVAAWMQYLQNIFKRETNCYITITIPPYTQPQPHKKPNQISDAYTLPMSSFGMMPPSSSTCPFTTTSDRRVPSTDLRGLIESRPVNKNFILKDENGQNITNVSILTNFDDNNKSIVTTTTTTADTTTKQTMFFTQTQFNILLFLFVLNLYIYEYCNQYECPVKKNVIEYFQFEL